MSVRSVSILESATLTGFESALTPKVFGYLFSEVFDLKPTSIGTVG